MYNDGIRNNHSEEELNNRIAEIFFENVKALREKNRLSQKEIGELIGFNNCNVSKWENHIAVPRNLDSVINAYADAFGIDATCLVDPTFKDRYDPSVFDIVDHIKSKPEVLEFSDTVIESEKKECTTDTKDIAVNYIGLEYEKVRKEIEDLEEKLRLLEAKEIAFRETLQMIGGYFIDEEEKSDET